MCPPNPRRRHRMRLRIPRMRTNMRHRILRRRPRRRRRISWRGHRMHRRTPTWRGPRCPVLGFPGELLRDDLHRRGLLDRRSCSGGGLASSSVQYGGHELSLPLIGGTLLLLHHFFVRRVVVPASASSSGALGRSCRLMPWCLFRSKSHVGCKLSRLINSKL